MADEERDDDEPAPRKKKAQPRDDEDDGGETDGQDDRPKKKKGGGGPAIIPTKNGMALTAYYTGVFGLIACIFGPCGIVFGFVPIICGVLGWMKANKDPEASGTAHAITGIVLGLVQMLGGCGVTIGSAIYFNQDPRRRP